MLTLRTAVGVGSATMLMHVAASPGLLLLAVDRTGLTYDTRLVAPEAGLIPVGTIHYVVLEGQAEWHATARTHPAPVAFALPAAEFEALGSGPRRSVRLSGQRFRAVEVWRERASATPDGVLEAAGPLVEAAGAYFDACRVGEVALSPDEERRWESSAAALLAASAPEDASARATDAAFATMPPMLRDTWFAFSDLVLTAPLSATQSQLADAAGRSSRQANRDFRAILQYFDAAGTGFRDLIQRWRLRAAVLFLSAADADIAAVARTVGYARAEAMANAFQRAGLPSPRRIRAQLVGP